MTRTASLALVALLAACGGDSPPPAPTPSPSVTSAAPTATATPTASRTASPKPSPTPSGTPMTTTGAYLRLARDPEPVPHVTLCEESYPELLDVSCGTVTLDGGVVLWVAGTRDGGDGGRRWALRLHTFEEAAGGFVLRYAADDPAGGWGGFRVGAARLTGYGVDGLIAQVTYEGTARRRGYDILTWRKGGPLVLRAHRADADQLRVVARENRLDDYEAAGDRFTYRQVYWNGTAFASRRMGTVAASKVPPAG